MITMNEVKSTAIRSIGYEPRYRILRIEFTSGDTYEYKEVSLLDYAEFMNAPSKGIHFHNIIKPYFDGKLI